MATSLQFVTLSNGEQLAVGVFNAFVKLQAAAKLATGDILWVASGYRAHAEQVRLFTTRYRQISSSAIRGPFNDVRFWNGSKYGFPGTTRWVRYSPEGTVAVPGTSLHEKASAVDWGGNGGKRSTRLGIWLKANAARFGFTPSGYGFGEPWHYDFTGNPWAGSGSTPIPDPTPTPPKPEPTPEPDEEYEEENMKAASYTKAAGNVPMVMLFDEGSGFCMEYSWGEAALNNAISGSWDTKPFVPVTESFASELRAALAKTRTGS